MIRYLKETKTFLLDTKNTRYVFEIAYDRFLVHLYYGKKTDDYRFVYEYPVNFTPIAEGTSTFSLDSVPLEYSGFGVGDYKTTSIRVKGRHNNSDTNFTYCAYRIFEGAVTSDGLPYARSGEGVQTLEIKLYDKILGCNLYLYYTVYPDCDVIVRSAKLENNGGDDVTIENFMSVCLDIKGRDYDVVALSGCYGSEMQMNRNPLFFGSQRVFSRRGATSHQFNPFMALCEKNTSLNEGGVYAMNLIYSGDFVSEAETSVVSLEKSTLTYTRLQTGIFSDSFSYKLAPNESFSTPQGVLTYAENGLNGVSKAFHDFTCNYLMFKQKKPNPIVLNTWEGCLYDIDEEKLVAFAKECKKIGIDTLVVDDGWFGHRDNDKSSLGDWFENRRKFSDGIEKFAQRIENCGVKLGIWIEPEMISEDSELYKEHPEWVIGNRNRILSLGRNQLVLDMSNPDVLKYLKKVLGELLDKTKVSYVKWDMNRHLSEVASVYLPADKQAEVSFRYMVGVYRLMNWFKAEYPQIVLETCSGGGGRYDLGMAGFSSMIWCSDNTNPIDRAYIQNGALLAYPARMLSCHISNPNGIIENKEELYYRYAVASQGQLGFEMDILKVSENTKTEIAKIVSDYRKLQPVITNGRYVCLSQPNNGGFSINAYYTDKEIFVTAVKVARNEREDNNQTLFFQLPFADENAVYNERYSGEKFLGNRLKEGLPFEIGVQEKYYKMFHFYRG